MFITAAVILVPAAFLPDLFCSFFFFKDIKDRQVSLEKHMALVLGEGGHSVTKRQRIKGATDFITDYLTPAYSYLG